MDLTSLGRFTGFISCLFIIIVTIKRQRRFEGADLGSFAVAYLSGSNIPPALFLCSYAIFPDPETILTKLHGLEKFVSFAGVSLLLITLISLWGLYLNAYELDIEIPEETPLPETKGEPQDSQNS